MNNNQIVRYVNVTEIDCGRSTELNPRLVNAITITRAFDPHVNQFRPLVVPVTQIFDPFNEITFHSSQNLAINFSAAQGNYNLNPANAIQSSFEPPRLLQFTYFII